MIHKIGMFCHIECMLYCDCTINLSTNLSVLCDIEVVFCQYRTIDERLNHSQHFC